MHIFHVLGYQALLQLPSSYAATAYQREPPAFTPSTSQNIHKTFLSVPWYLLTKNLPEKDAEI